VRNNSKFWRTSLERYDRGDVSDPTPPSAPYFDEARDAWVFSRYRDVMAALRDPDLWPVAARGEDHSVTRDEIGRLRLRGPVQEALAPRLDALSAHMKPLATRLLDDLPPHTPVDLLSEYALPWCREFALQVIQARPEDRDNLVQLGTEVFAATGAPDDSLLRPRAAWATAELDRLLKDAPVPMGEPTFVAISQTTPRLLANIWASLLDHPAEAERLRTDASLWPAAVEELLRFAGIVRRIWRQARSPVEYEGASILGGHKVLLMLASANRDPQQFIEPNRLDVTRKVSVQMALGAGRNSCAGGALVRMAVEISTRALWAVYPNLQGCGAPQFQTGSGYAFPTSVLALMTPAT
jgi:cytochrome P450